MAFKNGFCVVTFMLMTSLSATLASTVVVGRGECPNPGTQAAFDISRFLGTWYEYESFDQTPTVCVAAHYTEGENGTIDVVNEGFYERKSFSGITQRTKVRVTGKASVPDLLKPAALSLVFQGNDPSTAEPNYHVINTDYTTYAVVYSCTIVPARSLNLQAAWILTRNRGAAPANLVEIKQSLAASGISVNNFQVSNQSDCEGTNNPETTVKNSTPTPPL